MTEFDPSDFEKELKRLKPAAPSPEALGRLSMIPVEKSLCANPVPPVEGFWSRLFRSYWLVPAAAALVIGAVLLSLQLSSRPARSIQKLGTKTAASANHPIRADQIEIDQQLVTAFDAIARLPDGVPVRFHCREWKDEIVVRDSSRGVVIEREAPRLEVIPVRFETY